MTVFKWDKATPANNATIDASINWQEGQASSTVNDSARAMMTAVAKYRDDIAARIVTTNGPNNYSVTSNQGFISLAALDGAMIGFVPNITSATPTFLNVDSLGPKPLRALPGVELVASQLVAGTPYVATYFNASGQFILQGVPDLSGVTTAVVPVGAILPYAGTTAPSSSFALCFGQVLAQGSFTALFAVCGTAYNTGGEGVGNFRLPDMRGRVPAGLDNIGGVAASILTSSTMVPNATTLGAKGGFETHTIVAAELPAHVHHITWNDPTHAHTVPLSVNVNLGGSPGAVGPGGTTSTNSVGTGITIGGGSNNTDANTQSAVTPMTQPTILLNYIIRTL